MKSQTEGELGKMQFLYPVYLNQENLNINFIKWNCPQHFHFSPLYVKTEKIHPENIIENINKKKWNKSTILINSASADGGPRSRVCARETLRSAPHRH